TPLIHLFPRVARPIGRLTPRLLVPAPAPGCPFAGDIMLLDRDFHRRGCIFNDGNFSGLCDYSPDFFFLFFAASLYLSSKEKIISLFCRCKNITFFIYICGAGAFPL
ncbi:MAG: hypothetical protein K2I52_05090, partial [Muribaculaceae bacterium]|nr:hypothetical protein [Muribaculaceae bacterium]